MLTGNHCFVRLALLDTTRLGVVEGRENFVEVYLSRAQLLNRRLHRNEVGYSVGVTGCGKQSQLIEKIWSLLPNGQESKVFAEAEFSSAVALFDQLKAALPSRVEDGFALAERTRLWSVG